MPKKVIEKFSGLLYGRLFCAVLTACLLSSAAESQNTGNAGGFRVGEKVSYEISFGRFRDVGHLEVAVASQGTLAGQPALELRGRFRTFGVVGAAIAPIDEERVTIISPSTGLPLVAKKIVDPDGLRNETTTDFTKSGNGQFDILSLIYYIRRTGGTGSAVAAEGGNVYSVSFRPGKPATLQVPAGSFETDEIQVEGDLLSAFGIRRLSVFLSRSAERIPVSVKFTTEKGEFRLECVAISEPDEATPAPIPTPQPKPEPKPSPKPLPTPEPYVPNRPLSDDLPFVLGEALEYRISAADRPVGSVFFRVRERILADGRDSLVLNATVADAVAGNPALALNDSVTDLVDPVTLVPFRSDLKFSGGLRSFSQSIVFDQKGVAVVGATARVEVPAGVHTFLSLFYAMRSFNLSPSPVPDSRVNDTRVAVFWNNAPRVFTLRPGRPEIIEIAGKRIASQPVSITTGDADLDRLGLKVWLSADPSRIPLRITLGIYRADFVASSIVAAN